MASQWHIVCPGGDRSKLAAVEICGGLEHGLSDYRVASRESFPNPKEASAYALELARSNGRTYEALEDEPELNYLD